MSGVLDDAVEVLLTAGVPVAFSALVPIPLLGGAVGGVIGGTIGHALWDWYRDKELPTASEWRDALIYGGGGGALGALAGRGLGAAIEKWAIPKLPALQKFDLLLGKENLAAYGAGLGGWINRDGPNPAKNPPPVAEGEWVGKPGKEEPLLPKGGGPGWFYLDKSVSDDTARSLIDRNARSSAMSKTQA